ncbi:MAG TPA: cation-efflux pump [Terriglobales bacterium]|nr:cation-efflux pump [Terriglobales bacterium]
MPVTAAQSKQRIALLSLAAAVGMLLFKLVVGLHTGSLGILAEAAHSALDLLATVLTWISLRISARPADANHPFGHGKFESFSAFLEAGLLVVTALAIGGAAIHSWTSGGGQVVLDVWAFAVMLVSMAVDGWRASTLRRAAIEYRSDALAADALNFSSDLATSTAVLVGLAAVLAGQHWGIGWLRHADAAAACVVALAMVGLALRLGWRTAGVLLDEASPELARDLQGALAGVEGVTQVERVRLRRMGSRYFVDLQLGLEPASTLERAGIVRQEVAERIQRRLPEADVVIETQPRRIAPRGPYEQVQSVAHRRNLTIHDLSIYEVPGPAGEVPSASGSVAGSPADTAANELDIEFHLELDESLPLADAHELVCQLENEMRQALPTIRQIVTHIEPEQARVSRSNLIDPHRIARQVGDIALRVPEMLDCHDIQVRSSNGHLALSCHCSFPDTLPVGRVHELVSRLESDIKHGLPQLIRVTIHPEPFSDNRR